MKSKKANYDVAIIGGGIGGLMSAFRLIEKNPALNIVLFEKGKALDTRSCPMITKHLPNCIRCKTCSIMEGMAGAGAFSDGKYIISTEYGGWLPDFLPKSLVMNYIEQADSILVGFGATEERYAPNDELKRECLKYDLHMQQAQLKHLGTDSNFETMIRLISSLEGKVEVLTDTEVVDVNKKTHTVTTKDNEIKASSIIFAVGRVGSREFAKWCIKNDIEMTNNQVDIGVRVELPAIVWDHFSKKIYEPKILYRSKQYGDITRMFCFNERGNVCN